jgi:hypothetical protein
MPVTWEVLWILEALCQEQKTKSKLPKRRSGIEGKKEKWWEEGQVRSLGLCSLW